MKKFFRDFRAFINKGNVIDMAVGVVVGGAFGKITTSLVNDIIMPLIGKLIGGLDVSEWKWVLTPAQEAVEATETTPAIPAVAEVAVRYGNFIQLILDFLIISFCVFAVIKMISKAREKAEAKKKAEEAAAAAEAAKEPEPTKEELLLAEIRDLLKEKK